MIDPIANQECQMAKQALINSYQNLLIREQATLTKAKTSSDKGAVSLIQARVDKLIARLSQLTS